MRIMYIECNMGAAGDMLTAALAEATGDVKGCENTLNALGIPGVSYSFVPSVKCGITGTHAEVAVNGVTEDEHMHEHHHEHEHEHEHDHGHEHDRHAHEHHEHGEDDRCE
jgi:uncharacterized protein (DUF111 family)